MQGNRQHTCSVHPAWAIILQPAHLLRTPSFWQFDNSDNYALFWQKTQYASTELPCAQKHNGSIGSWISPCSLQAAISSEMFTFTPETCSWCVCIAMTATANWPQMSSFLPHALTTILSIFGCEEFTAVAIQDHIHMDNNNIWHTLGQDCGEQFLPMI